MNGGRPWYCMNAAELDLSVDKNKITLRGTRSIADEGTDMSVIFIVRSSPLCARRSEPDRTRGGTDAVAPGPRVT